MAEISSVLCCEISLVGAFLLRSVCVPIINRDMGLAYDVTDCYNLGKKWIPFIDMFKCLPAYSLSVFLHTNSV